jgi:RNA polymerase sigma-70 factor (ECF subfamily)
VRRGKVSIAPCPVAGIALTLDHDFRHAAHVVVACMNCRITQAFATQLIAQLPATRRYALALCGNATLADDLVQDGIERALTRANTLQQPESLGAWLRSIVHHLFLDELRRRRVRGVAVDMEDMADDLALSTSGLDHDAPNDVARAMARLSVEHRQILILAGVEQLSYQEIAEELAVPLGTVMSRLSRARSALRSLLEPTPRPVPATLQEQRP